MLNIVVNLSYLFIVFLIIGYGYTLGCELAYGTFLKGGVG